MNQTPPHPRTGASRAELPRVNRLFSGGRHRYDALGFLDVDHSPELFQPEHLFEEPAGLIVGAPWLGKTTTARRLAAWLGGQPPGLAFGERLCLTELGRHGDERSLPPAWWETWARAATISRACWIIDALDEGEERLRGVRERILHAVGELDDTRRSNLRLLIFSRQRDWLPEFREELGRAYGLGPIRSLPEFHLAPLHQEAAREMLAGEPGAFDHVLALIRDYKLQPVAGFPAALDYLRRQSQGTGLTVVDVWRGVLLHLLGEPNSGRRRGLRSELEERFSAATRIAAVLTLTGTEQVIERTVVAGPATLADLFPLGRDPRLRVAAREACEVGPFLPTAEGGYRFAQRNVRDWLAAFSLAGLGASRLRSALGDGSGIPAAHHRDLLPLLRQVSTDPEVRAWIDSLSGGLPLPSDQVSLTLENALGYIDQLERVADSAPAGFWMHSGDLRLLAAPGLGGHIEARLRDPGRSAAAKDLLLDVARATDPDAALPAALGLVLDRGQSAELRRRAFLLVLLHGGNAHFRQLAGPVARGPAESRGEQQLKAGVIRALLERRIWEIPEAAAHAPPAEPHVVDDRHMLLRMLEERMTAEDARALLRNRGQQGAAPRLVIDEYHDRDLLDVALDRLLKEEQLDSADEELLVEAALARGEDACGLDPAFAVLQRLRHAAAVRQRLYEYGIERQRRDPEFRRVCSHALQLADWPWLLGRVRDGWADVPAAVKDLYWLARAAHQVGEADTAAWEEVLRLVERHAPEVPAHYEQDRQAYERVRERNEQMERELERKRPVPTSLREAVTKLLGDRSRTPEDRMRRLSWLCFVPDYRDPRVVGTWEELDATLQSRVLAAARDGLERGTPTPIPDDQPFPGTIIFEAWAFLQVLEDPEQPDWLTPERVRRWLPTAVFALHGHIPALAHRCAAIDRAATLDILLAAAERDLRRGGRFAIYAGQIPVEFWDSPVVAERITLWAREGSYQAEARASLLELLTHRAPDYARAVATEWSVLPADGGETAAALRRAGLNCRLVLDPEGALPLVEGDFARKGAEALEELTALQGFGRDGLQTNLADWPAPRLEALGGILLRAYPVRSDPDREGRVMQVTAETELRDTRDRVFWTLLSRDDKEARTAAESLASCDEGLRARLQDYKARKEAESILAALPPRSGDSGTGVSLAAAVRLLDEADYRLIRSGDDLLEAVCEALRLIERDIVADLAMLYGPPPRKKGAERKHLEEDALQAYLRRRIGDVLRGRVLDPQVKPLILREDQVGFRRRLDLRVTAPCLGAQALAQVVIEVKWSDNKETESSLTEQLGRKYLLGEQLNHGVYLVGWCGWWSRKGQGTQTDRTELEAHLQMQAEEFRAANVPRTMSIRAVILGLEWRDPADTA